MLKNLADMSFSNFFRLSRSCSAENLSNHITETSEDDEVQVESNIHHSQRYEELMSGNVPCPTCRGSGKIPKGLSHRISVQTDI